MGEGENMNYMYFNITLVSATGQKKRISEIDDINIGYVKGDPIISGVNNGSIVNIKNNKSWQDDIWLYIIVGIIIALSAYLIIKTFSN